MGKAYSFVRSSGSILNSDQRSDLKKLCFFDINWLNLEHRPTAFKWEKPRFLCEWLAKFSTLIDYVLARVSTIFCSRYWRNSLYWYIIQRKTTLVKTMASTIHYIGRIAVSEVEDRIIYMLFKIMFDYYMDTGCKFAYKHFKSIKPTHKSVGGKDVWYAKRQQFVFSWSGHIFIFHFRCLVKSWVTLVL